MINQGLIGELYDMEVRLTTYTPWDIFPHVAVHPRLEVLYHSIHYMDLIRSFLGEPKRIMFRAFRHPTKTYSSTRTTTLLDYRDSLRAVINTNHDHDFGAHNQESFIKWEGTKGAIKARMGLLLDYPKGVPDLFEYCLTEEGENWKTMQLEGSWFPDAFVGTMSALMRYAEGSSKDLPTSVEDVIRTMRLVESAYECNDHGGITIENNEQKRQK
jgi:predicted dehydrogenase